jgi:nucleotide-binding universal stress UspA family protein
MKILFAADENRYSQDAIPQLARLGENTWADITILGIGSKEDLIDKTIKEYQHQILKYFDPATSPYIQSEPKNQDQFTIQKEIITKVRKGNASKQILLEALDNHSDLIVMGCSTEKDCAWENSGNVPLKVSKDALSSVLVIKEDKQKVKKVLCCLDHDNISQESLEMVSQMVTLFNADLEIVILTEGEDIQEKVEKKLSWLVNYYSARKIFPYIELVNTDNFEKFISQRSRWGLMAMWMGKQSIFEKLFPSNKLSRLLKANESSVLLLR